VYIQHLLSHSVRSSGASLGGTSAHGEPSGITINDHHDHPAAGTKQLGVKVLHKKDTKQGCEIKRESSFIKNKKHFWRACSQILNKHFKNSDALYAMHGCG